MFVVQFVCKNPKRVNRMGLKSNQFMRSRSSNKWLFENFKCPSNRSEKMEHAFYISYKKISYQEKFRRDLWTQTRSINSKHLRFFTMWTWQTLDSFGTRWEIAKINFYVSTFFEKLTKSQKRVDIMSSKSNQFISLSSSTNWLQKFWVSSYCVWESVGPNNKKCTQNTHNLKLRNIDMNVSLWQICSFLG